MQFLVTAYDGTDSNALGRRMKVREDHLKNVKELKESGNFIWGGALLGDDDSMIGSVIVYDFNTRADLDLMLESEPYILGKVWENIRVKKFKLASI